MRACVVIHLSGAWYGELDKKDPLKGCEVECPMIPESLAEVSGLVLENLLNKQSLYYPCLAEKRTLSRIFKGSFVSHRLEDALYKFRSIFPFFVFVVNYLHNKRTNIDDFARQFAN
jgi:hypothetical protein